jgi:6-phosphofructokinase 2
MVGLSRRHDMQEIVTLAMNPSIDVSTSTHHVAPVEKLRCGAIRRDPGGGGINVARVLRRFGADVTAIYPIGGSMGRLLRHLVDAEDIASIPVQIAEETRESFTVFEESTERQYRFVLPGPHLSRHEYRNCLDALDSLDRRPGFFVVSGSLPPGVPDDFYAQIAPRAKTWGARLICDTSGPALKSALTEGVYLVKPNLRELSELVGTELTDEKSRIAACVALVERGSAEIVALTLGDQGALLVTRDRAWRARAVPIQPVSTVGAGDSFLGAMVWSLASGHDLPTAFRYGVAAGTAALLTPGTELCRPEDVDRLRREVAVEPARVPQQASG